MESLKCPMCSIVMRANLLPRHLVVSHQAQPLEAKLSCAKLRFPSVSIEAVVQRYLVEKSSPREIGLEFNIPPSLVRSLVELSGAVKRGRSQAKQTASYKNCVKNTLQSRYGVDNPSQIDEVKQKKIATSLKNTGFVNRFCDPTIRAGAEKLAVEKTWTPEWRRGYYHTLQEKYGVDNIARVREIAQRSWESNRIRISKLTTEERFTLTAAAREARLGLGGFSSKIELRVGEVLNDLGVTYTSHAHISKYYLDFLVELLERKIIIEVQGSFWHAWPEKYKPSDLMPVMNITAQDIWDRDAQKRKRLEDLGYEVHYIWEHEMDRASRLVIDALEGVKHDCYSRPNFKD
jgi:G:T-mismatch repair DNA endonuclease (very short patch repair protein)